MKLDNLINVCLNEGISISKHLSDSFPIRNGLKQGDAVSPLILDFALKYAIKKVPENNIGLKLTFSGRSTRICALKGKV
jgi:hypothetical protein